MVLLYPQRRIDGENWVLIIPGAVLLTLSLLMSQKSNLNAGVLCLTKRYIMAGTDAFSEQECSASEPANSPGPLYVEHVHLVPVCVSFDGNDLQTTAD